MSYQTELQNALTNYQKMLEVYEQLISSQRYFEIISTMPFEFLGAAQLCDKLTLYERLEKKPRMFFASKEEAYIFYQSLIKFPEKSKKLLEDAAYMAEVGKVASDLNRFASTSPYLGDTYKVVPNNDIITMAEKCLREIPLYRKKLTKEFRWNYIESVILSLNQEELDWLLEKKVIKSIDIDNISLTETVNQYQEKVKHLCTALGRELPAEATYIIKLKAVTFNNDDGVSRQDVIKKMQAMRISHPMQPIRLVAIPYVFTPEVGNPEPAVRIEWEGQCIGNVGKDVVAEVDSKFNHPQYTADLVDITGGNDVAFGCKIKLGVIAPEIIKEASSSIPQGFEPVSEKTQTPVLN